MKTSSNKRDFQIFIFVRAPWKISLLKMLNAWKRREIHHSTGQPFPWKTPMAYKNELFKHIEDEIVQVPEYNKIEQSGST